MTAPRLEVPKTCKLYIGGSFVRSESGRTVPVLDAAGALIAHAARASRKDLRDAVEAARKAQPPWGRATAYNRGQVLYRMAEMMEGKRAEFAETLRATERRSDGAARRKVGPRTKPGARAIAGSEIGAQAEVAAAIDRLVCFAGWADKYAQVLGCNNPVAGPYYNFTVPEPTGVVAVIAPDRPGLLGLISLLAPPLCAGNTVVALAGERFPVAAALLGEVCATSDVPAGAVNILTGVREELLSHVASHRDIDAIHAAITSPADAAMLRAGAAENLKRVSVRDAAEVGWFDDAACHSPWWIEPFVEMKTVWHPSAT